MTIHNWIYRLGCKHKNVSYHDTTINTPEFTFSDVIRELLCDDCGKVLINREQQAILEYYLRSRNK